MEFNIHQAVLMLFGKKIVSYFGNEICSCIYLIKEKPVEKQFVDIAVIVWMSVMFNIFNCLNTCSNANLLDLFLLIFLQATCFLSLNKKALKYWPEKLRYLCYIIFYNMYI